MQSPQLLEPESLNPLLRGLPLLSLLLHRRLLVKTPLLYLLEQALLLELPLQGFQRLFHIISVNFYVQDCYLLPLPKPPLPPPPPPPKPRRSLGCWGLASATDSVLSMKVVPFRASIALRASSSVAISIKAKPFGFPVCLSVMIFTDSTSPLCAKSSLMSSSLALNEMLPT